MVFNPGKGVGLRNVGSYQISGHPFLTGSRMTTGQEIKVSFPFVARDVTVIASGSTAANGPQGHTSTGPVLRVHFNASGSAVAGVPVGGAVIGPPAGPGLHYITLKQAGASINFETKCKEIYITCAENGGADSGFELIANLTGIGTTQMYALTGSGLKGG